MIWFFIRVLSYAFTFITVFALFFVEILFLIVNFLIIIILRVIIVFILLLLIHLIALTWYETTLLICPLTFLTFKIAVFLTILTFIVAYYSLPAFTPFSDAFVLHNLLICHYKLLRYSQVEYKVIVIFLNADIWVACEHLHWTLTHMSVIIIALIFRLYDAIFIEAVVITKRYVDTHY